MKTLRLTLALLVALCTFSANAALFNFTGNIAYHNDVVYTYFTLNSNATNVRIWTDSFQNAVNFDPITALWDSSGNLLGQNDDNAGVNPGTQTYYDSGFTLPTLAAGTYLFTIATYPNFAASNLLSGGFQMDGQAPIALADWCQPASHCAMGTFWSVWLDGVDSAHVPEPSSLALLGVAMAAFGVSRKKKAV